MPTPVGIRLRMYQVGFGDCFLLTFEYDKPVDGTRKGPQILIDFGTMRAHPKWSHKAIAELIKEHSHGRLDAIVVTHRHRNRSGSGAPYGCRRRACRTRTSGESSRRIRPGTC